MKSRTRRKLRFLLGFGGVFTVLWLFWSSPVVYPLKLFVVLLHELSHAAAAIATGGEVLGIAVTANEGGVCRCPGGSAFLTLSAGYLGSLGWGALLFWTGMRGGRRASRALGLVGVLVAALTLLTVRNAFGLVFGVLFGVALLGASRWLRERASGLLLAGLGLVSCLYAILDIKSDVLDRPHLPSDAAMLAELTGVPTLAWGLLWIAVALAASGALLRWAWRRS